jgi:hypothetical protein
VGEGEQERKISLGNKEKWYKGMRDFLMAVANYPIALRGLLELNRSICGLKAYFGVAFEVLFY